MQTKRNSLLGSQVVTASVTTRGLGPLSYQARTRNNDMIFAFMSERASRLYCWVFQCELFELTACTLHKTIHVDLRINVRKTFKRFAFGLMRLPSGSISTHEQHFCENNSDAKQRKRVSPRPAEMLVRLQLQICGYQRKKRARNAYFVQFR